MIYSTQEQLEEALAKWKKILLLQDWDVRIRFARHSRIGDCDGSVKVWYDQMQAGISISEEADSMEDRYEGFEVDMEHVIVHELIHIRMHPLTPDREKDPLRYELFEAFVNSQARVLVAQQRVIEKQTHEALSSWDMNDPNELRVEPAR